MLKSELTDQSKILDKRQTVLEGAIQEADQTARKPAQLAPLDKNSNNNLQMSEGDNKFSSPKKPSAPKPEAKNRPQPAAVRDRERPPPGPSRRDDVDPPTGRSYSPVKLPPLQMHLVASQSGHIGNLLRSPSKKAAALEKAKMKEVRNKELTERAAQRRQKV